MNWNTTSQDRMHKKKARMKRWKYNKNEQPKET
jgi:hypothetical protein